MIHTISQLRRRITCTPTDVSRLFVATCLMVSLLAFSAASCTGAAVPPEDGPEAPSASPSGGTPSPQPDSPEPEDSPKAAPLDQARSLVSAHKFEEAAAAYTRLIQEQPSVEAYIGRGWANTGRGRHEDALRDFDKAIELDPDNADSYHWRAKYHATRPGKSQAALGDIQTAVRLAPENVGYQVDEVEIRWYHRNFIENNFVRDVKELANRIADNTDAAAEQFERIASSFPQSSLPLAAMGKLHFKTAPILFSRSAQIRGIQQAAKSVQAFDRAIEREPKVAELYANRAEVRWAYGQGRDSFKAVLEDLFRSTTLDPEKAPGLPLLVALLADKRNSGFTDPPPNKIVDHVVALGRPALRHLPKAEQRIDKMEADWKARPLFGVPQGAPRHDEALFKHAREMIGEIRNRIEKAGPDMKPTSETKQ